MSSSGVRRGLVVVLFALLTLAATAGPAGAHANLVSISPKESQVFPAGSPPTKVVVTFDESVTAKSAISVYDGRGKPVRGVTQRDQSGKVVTAQLPDLVDGAYAIVWHVVSEDGHPEHGVSTFSVGAGGTGGARFGALGSAQSSGHGYGVVYGIVRFLAFLGAIGFVGALVVARWCWPQSIARRDVRVLLLTAAGIAIAAALLVIPFQAGYASGGGWSKLTDSGAIGDVLDVRSGRGALARVLLLVALVPFAVLRIRAPRAVARIPVETVVGLCSLGVLATFAYAGHASTGRWIGAGVALDLVHLTGVSAWLGGIALFAVTLLRIDDVGATLRAVERFGRVALPAIAVVVLSGVVQGWRQLESWSALWDTDYGHLLIAKVFVVASIVIVASASRDILRDRIAPHLTARDVAGDVAGDGAGDAAGDGAGDGAGNAAGDDVAQLRTAILIEVLLAAVVLAITAALVVSAP